MRDGIILTDKDSSVTVNQYSYCELIKWLIVEYAGISYHEASTCVEQHISFFESICAPIDVALEEHNWPYYYTAMDIYFGGHLRAEPVQTPPDTLAGLALYKRLEMDILRKHNLKEPFIWEE